MDLQLIKFAATKGNNERTLEEVEEIENTLNLFAKFFFEDYYLKYKEYDKKTMMKNFNICEKIYQIYDNYATIVICYLMNRNYIYFHEHNIKFANILQYKFLCLFVSKKLNKLFYPQTKQIDDKVYVYGVLE